MIYKHQEYMHNDELIYIYNRMCDEGIYNTVFIDGALSTFGKWVEYVRSKCWLVHVYDGEEPFGVFWLDGFNGRIALFHYFLYKSSWGRINEALQPTLEWLKESIGSNISHLIGYTPTKNRLAIRVLKRAGFEVKFALEDAIKCPDGHYESMTVSHRRL